MWAVVGSTASWLLVSTVAPAALHGLVVVGHRLQPLSRPIATLVAAVLLVGTVRLSPSSASVAPPAERVIVEGGRAASLATDIEAFQARFTSASTISSYTVVAGDTLWGIAKRFLAQGSPTPTGAEISIAWKAIYAANVDVVGDDPNLILPGQVLTIPGGIHG